MSPLEYIEEGIKEGDWEKVCEGYERLTGTALSLPVELPGEVRKANEALRQIVTIASEILPVDETWVQSTVIEPEKKKRGRPKGSGKKKVAKAKKTTKKKQQTDGDDDPTLQLDDGNKTAVQKEAGGIRLITNEPDPDEVEKNKAKAERAKKNKMKLSRQAAQKYRVKCNECGEIFESDRKNGEMGQKCPSCLREKKSRFS
jgi:hypothetical protein